MTNDKIKFLENSPFFKKSADGKRWIFEHDGKSYIEDDVLEFIPIDSLARYGFFLTKDRFEAQEVVFKFLNHVRYGKEISKREFGLAEWVLSSIAYDLDDARQLPHKKIRGKGQHKKETLIDKYEDDKKFIYYIENKILNDGLSQKDALLDYIEHNYPPGISTISVLSALQKRLNRLRKKYKAEFWYPKKWTSNED